MTRVSTLLLGRGVLCGTTSKERRNPMRAFDVRRFARGRGVVLLKMEANSVRVDRYRNKFWLSIDEFDASAIHLSEEAAIK